MQFFIGLKDHGYLAKGFSFTFDLKEAVFFASILEALKYLEANKALGEPRNFVIIYADPEALAYFS